MRSSRVFQGCQFREHCPDERLAADAAALELCGRFRDIIAMRPPALMFPERLTRLVPRGHFAKLVIRDPEYFDHN